LKKYQLYNDTALLGFLSENDERAFTEIYNRYWKILYAIAYSRVGNIQVTEDIVHDVLASLWINRAKLNINSLPNYLASATKYMIFASIRKNTHEQHYLDSLQETAMGFDIENSVHNKCLLEFVHKEVETLPEKCRLIFKYSREKGMTNKQIAEELKITSKTVENQINKALHHLRISMKKILQSLF
jgi:RNA polymerase sigma-70 factor (ECF subfamily)